MRSFEKLKMDYDIHTMVSHDIPSLNQLSRQFNHAGPVLIKHSAGIALYGYDLEKREWQIKTLQIDSDVQYEMSQLFSHSKVKLSQLSNTLKDQICSNHSEVVRQLPRQPTLRTEEAREIRTGDFSQFRDLHGGMRERHPHHPGRMVQRTRSNQQLPYQEADQLTNYRVRSRFEIYKDIHEAVLAKKGSMPAVRSAPFSIEPRGIPASVKEFDTTEQHMLFIPNENESEEKKLQVALDIRLGPALKGLLRNYGEDGNLEVFEGSLVDMLAFYRSRDFEINDEIQFPSTGRYYRFINTVTHQDVMVLGALQSEANLISQLLTLKKAGVTIDKVKIYGDTISINQSIEHDIKKFRELLISKDADFHHSALVIAGNGGILDQAISKSHHIDLSKEIIISPEGSRCKMTYYPLLEGSGIINLQMPYGEVMGPMVSVMAEELSVRRIFLAGVGGALVTPEKNKTDPVGQFYLFGRSHDDKGTNAYELELDEMLLPNPDLTGSAVVFDDLNNKTASHVHVDSPFLETRSWLERNQQSGHTVVDCETHYCFEAIKKWNQQKPDDKIKIMPGLFISDVVGHSPLVSVSHNSYKWLDSVLDNFVQKIQEEKPFFSLKRP